MSAGRVPADPSAKNIWCDAKDHAHPRKYLEQNIFSKRGVQVELEHQLDQLFLAQTLKIAPAHEGRESVQPINRKGVGNCLGVTVLRPPSNTGSKAGAQTYALPFVKTALCMAIDADTELAPDAVE